MQRKSDKINDENWKIAYTEGYVFSLIIGGGAVAPLAPPVPTPLLYNQCTIVIHMCMRKLSRPLKNLWYNVQAL